jgi:membrane-bound ClpP family serine protease
MIPSPWPATAVAAVATGVEVVVPAAIGLAVADMVRPGFALVAIAGFVLTVTGVLRLACRSAVRPSAGFSSLSPPV